MHTKFMHNHHGSMVAMIMMLMTFLLISVTLLWQGVLMMHDSAIARQKYMYKKVALEDLLYYAIAQAQNKSTVCYEYAFDRWPLHSRARWWWQAKVIITIADSGYHINANLFDKEHVALCGSCKLTTTVEDSDSIWLVDAWIVE